MRARCAAHERWISASSLLVFLALLPLLLGCTGFRYVVQAGCGQLDISLGARSIEGVLSDEGVKPRTRALLSQVASIKRFGERHGLTPTRSYDEYVELGRPAAVWVVSASEPLRFRMKSWSFPIVGGVPYLGWFDRDDAQGFAGELRDEGWDVDVRGAGAYSTLGWFDDPVLSTMIPEGDEALGELANVVLHESVHATFYIAGQTWLNESVASFMGDALAKVYLDERVGQASVEKQAYMRREIESEQRAKQMHAAYQRLDRLYASSAPDEVKLTEKQRILRALGAEIHAKRPLTNATLAQFKTYHSSAGELDALLRACGGSWVRFLASLKRLRGGAFAGAQERAMERVIMPLVRGGCRS